MLTDVYERAKHWKTSTAGVAGAACAYYLFTSLGCQFPSNWRVWAVTAIPAILGILSK